MEEFNAKLLKVRSIEAEKAKRAAGIDYLLGSPPKIIHHHFKK